MINLYALPLDVLRMLILLDQDLYAGTASYMGIGYFWHYEFRHCLRPANRAQRLRVHAALLRAGLDVCGYAAAHVRIVHRVLRLPPAELTAMLQVYHDYVAEHSENTP